MYLDVRRNTHGDGPPRQHTTCWPSSRFKMKLCSHSRGRKALFATEAYNIYSLLDTGWGCLSHEHTEINKSSLSSPPNIPPLLTAILFAPAGPKRLSFQWVNRFNWKHIVTLHSMMWWEGPAMNLEQGSNLLNLIELCYFRRWSSFRATKSNLQNTQDTPCDCHKIRLPCRL